MPQPLNYMLDTAMPNPVGGFLQGIQLVQQLEQQKAAEEQAKQRKAIMGRLAALGTNATPDDYVAASLALPEDRELFKQNWDIIEPAKKDAVFKGGQEAFMLANSGDNEGAKAKLEEWALGFENAGDKENADKFRTAAKMMEVHPETAKATIGMMLSFADGERFKNIMQPSESTTFQKDFNFIKETFGEDAAAEYAQYGRDNIVSIPLGNGQTYVGPASAAPGAAKWQAKQSGAETKSAADILTEAQKSKQITQAEAGVIKESLGLGPNGAAQFQSWLKDKGIKVIVRTGMKDGRRVVQYEDGTIDYAGDAGSNASGGFRD